MRNWVRQGREQWAGILEAWGYTAPTKGAFLYARPSTSHSTATILFNLLIDQGGRYYYLQFTEEETEAQRVRIWGLHLSLLTPNSALWGRKQVWAYDYRPGRHCYYAHVSDEGAGSEYRSD